MNSRPIHYVLWQIGRGGVELQVRHYVEAFADARDLYIYSVKPYQEELYDLSRVSVSSGRSEGWGWIWDYYRYCRKHRKEIFHIASAGPIALCLCLLAGVRDPIYHIRGTIYWKTWSQRIYLRLLWVICSLFKVTYIPNSAHSARVFSREIMPIAEKPIYNCFDVDNWVGNRRRRKQLRRLGYAGRFAPGKNVDQLIRLFESVAEDHPLLELHLAGDGPLLEEITAMCEGSPYTDRIFLHGFVEDIRSFYESIDLFVFISSFESFGNVVAEALLTGAPVLTSDVPVFSEIYGDVPDFNLGDPENTLLLERNFAQAVAVFDQLSHIAMRVSEQVSQNFRVQNHIRQFDQIYRAH